MENAVRNKGERELFLPPPGSAGMIGEVSQTFLFGQELADLAD